MTVNERIAERVMGWRLGRTRRSGLVRWCDETHRWVVFRNFEHSLDACAIAEAEIERRGLKWEYFDALKEILFAILRSNAWGHEFYWELLTVKPRQRCEAMLAAVAVSDSLRINV